MSRDLSSAAEVRRLGEWRDEHGQAALTPADLRWIGRAPKGGVGVHLKLLSGQELKGTPFG